MAIPSRQIGWSQESNVLYEISRQLDQILKFGGGASGTPITGSGAAGQVAFFTAPEILSGSNNLFWDIANSRLGIGNSTPTERLDVTGVVRATALTVAGGGTFTPGLTNGNINLGANLGVGLTSGSPTQRLDVAGSIRLQADLGNGIFGTTSSGGTPIWSMGRTSSPSNGTLSINTLGGINFGVGNATLGTANGMILYPSGNLVISDGTYSDTGERLNVGGNTQITGNLVTTNSLNEMYGTTADATTSVLTLFNSTPVQLIRFQNDGKMYLGSTNNLFIHSFSTDPATTDLAGSNLSFRTIPSNSDASAGAFNLSFQANSTQTSGTAYGMVLSTAFAPPSGDAQFACLLIEPTIDQAAGATGITRGLLINNSVNVNATNYRAIETNNLNGYQAYFGGSAPILFGSCNFEFGSTVNTGTRFGTSNLQKLAFWNATPVVQPDTTIAAAAYTSVAGTAVTTTGTFEGYTLSKVVAALRRIGLLA
jgi:hypothetical protein